MKLSPELIAEIGRLELKARHLASEQVAGEYASAFKGKGMEFDEVREYHPGDDIRSIDWNVTARMNQPFIKVFKEERELTVFLLIDMSGSQDYGSAGKSKKQIAAELAAAIAFLAIRGGDKVGLLVFSDHVETYIPPKKGRGHTWRIISHVLSHQGASRGTDIGAALGFFSQVRKRRALCFLISDFMDEGYQPLLKQVARKHELVCALTSDPREVKLPSAGILKFRDLETGGRTALASSDPFVNDRYRRNNQARLSRIGDDFKRWGIDAFSVGNHNEPISALRRYLHCKEARRRAILEAPST